MSRRVVRWREGRHGKRQRKGPPAPPPEKIAIRKVIYGVALVLLNVAAVLGLALWLDGVIGLPAAVGFGVLLPVTLTGFVWGPRDKTFYVMMGGMASLWIVITLLLTLSGDWAAWLFGAG